MPSMEFINRIHQHTVVTHMLHIHIVYFILFFVFLSDLLNEIRALKIEYYQ